MSCHRNFRPGQQGKLISDPPLAAPDEHAQLVQADHFSRFAEGFWKVPIKSNATRNPDFGSWQRIEFTWAPVGERKVSSLPDGEYWFVHSFNL